jgi:hypothetical protein
MAHEGDAIKQSLSHRRRYGEAGFPENKRQAFLERSASMLVVKGHLCGRLSLDSDQSVAQDLLLSAGCRQMARKANMDGDYDPEILDFEPDSQDSPIDADEIEEEEEVSQ